MISLPDSPSEVWAKLTRMPPISSGGAFDEAFDSGGTPRSHWRGLLHAIGVLGRDEFAVRVENGRRVLREQGVSHGNPRDPGAVERLWELDFLPLLVSAEEWRHLAAGLVQRARLLNAVLGDLYGVQRLVRDGFVPAPLIYANPGYLRACQALNLPGGTYLHSYAADLTRAPDGKWFVLADRTQAPTGLGFAQESRSIMARILPEAVRASQPRPLADSLRLRREMFRCLARDKADAGNVVLLTPGPGNEAYFEDAYLARLLGLALAEGEDLSVRDRKVFLKNLNGLRRVDVILRRVNDVFCDPLELRADSLLGVPGLVEATRAGHVTVANALGSGLLESPAFLPFLETLCQHLFEEPLALASVPTRWCGERRDKPLGVQDSGERIVRPAFQLAAHPRKPGQGMEEQLTMHPYEWVEQQPIRASKVPVIVNGRWERKSFVLRIFVIHDGHSFTAIPGGLARVMQGDSLSSISLSLAGPCKDVWVLQDESSTLPAQPAPISSALNVERSPSDLPSRSADNFFWMGRYAERLEYRARVARCVVEKLSEETGPGTETRFEALARLLTRLELIGPGVAGAHVREELQQEILRLLYEEDQACSMRDLLKRIRLGSFSLRHRLSADTWGILSRIAGSPTPRLGPLPLVQAAETLNSLIVDLAAFSGMQMENVTRGHGWMFLDLGRRLERALSVAHSLQAVVAQQEELELLFEPVLEISDSTMTYRWRYFAVPRLDGILELLLVEPTNPRSLAFQVNRIQEHAASLPAGTNPAALSEVRRRIGLLAGTIRRVEWAELAQPDRRSAALAWLAGTARELGQLSELLTHLYFSHVQPRAN